ncbi:TetR family transcriptional regulator [Nocardia sp. XZ_19_385]|uniref:TetR family transcriptional regulator n=1 Tax=Nocardia sp. XZ_19_385 TaxID=2769488 RepID=UPI001E3C1972|nr:TetR family transcriptional regulator [Nocardia sp. XZ_19_385]
MTVLPFAEQIPDSRRKCPALSHRNLRAAFPRQQITDAARRVIAAGGLEAATFQSVAAEAGVSVR